MDFVWSQWDFSVHSKKKQQLDQQTFHAQNVLLIHQCFPTSGHLVSARLIKQRVVQYYSVQLLVWCLQTPAVRKFGGKHSLKYENKQIRLLIFWKKQTGAPRLFLPLTKLHTKNMVPTKNNSGKEFSYKCELRLGLKTWIEASPSKHGISSNVTILKLILLNILNLEYQRPARVWWWNFRIGSWSSQQFPRN